MKRRQPPPFSPDDKVYLSTLRDDIAARSDFYLLGPEYLQSRHSVNVLYSADLEVWERLRQIDLSRIKPDRDSGDYCLSRRLIRVFSELLIEGLVTPDDDLNP